MSCSGCQTGPSVSCWFQRCSLVLLKCVLHDPATRHTSCAHHVAIACWSAVCALAPATFGCLRTDSSLDCPGADATPKPRTLVASAWGDGKNGDIEYIDSMGMPCGTVVSDGCNPSTTLAALTHVWKPLHYGMGTYLLYDSHSGSSGTNCAVYDMKVSVTVV
jgi:hypothetical protein